MSARALLVAPRFPLRQLFHRLAYHGERLALLNQLRLHGGKHTVLIGLVLCVAVLGRLRIFQRRAAECGSGEAWHHGSEGEGWGARVPAGRDLVFFYFGLEVLDLYVQCPLVYLFTSASV